MSLASNNAILVWRVVREPLEELSFLPQRIGVDTIAQFFLKNALGVKSLWSLVTHRRNKLFTIAIIAGIDGCTIDRGSKGC